MRFRRRGGGPPAGDFGLADGDRLPKPLPLVGGWLLAERGYGRVELRIEGAAPVRARVFSGPQDELAAVSPEPSAPMASWSTTIDVSGMEPGVPLELEARAIGPAGELRLGSARVTPAERPPRGPDPAFLDALSARAIATAAGYSPPPGLHLFVFLHELTRTGAPLLVLELVGSLVRDPDLRCTVIAPTDGDLRAEFERLGAAVHLSPRSGFGDGYESHMRELAALARREGATAVLANTTMSFQGVDLADRLGIPAVWLIHESAGLNHVLYGHLDWADDHVAARLRAALESADRIVFGADSTLEVLAAETSDPTRLVRVDYGTELARIHHVRRELDRERLRAERGLAASDRLLLCAGTLEPRKSQVSLALAFGRVAPEFPDAKLALVGKQAGTPEGYSRGTERVIGRLGTAGSRIAIEPATANVFEWFAAADALVVASDMESMPRVIHEAMAFGLPVLSTAVFGAAELIEDGVNGLLCETRDLDSLETGLRRLLAMPPAEAAGLAQAGERTLAGRDTDAYARELRAIFDRLLAGAGPP